MFNIALNTFRELVRNRILTIILFSSVVMIGFSLVLASLSLGQSDRIVGDFGLAMIELCGLISVVFVGGQILFKELEGRTIYLILSKPVPRSSFILGKFLGFSMVLVLSSCIQALVFFGILLYTKGSIDPLIFVAIASMLVKLLVTFSVILLFSTFTNPILSILVTIGVFVAGHGASALVDMGEYMKNLWLINGGKALLTILPNFEALNFAKNTLGTPVGVNGWILATNIGTGLLYLCVILLVTVVIFERKSFENA